MIVCRFLFFFSKKKREKDFCLCLDFSRVLSRPGAPSRGGVLTALPHPAGAARVAATQAALGSGAPAVFEATFIADDTFVAIDVLEKLNDGYRLTEVKSSSSQKDEHISDVAIQARVAAAGGGQGRAAEGLHLNKHFRHPASGDLFARTDVTGPVAAFIPPVPDGITR